MCEALRSGRRELTVVLRACGRLLRSGRGRAARSTRDRLFRGHRGETTSTSSGQRSLRRGHGHNHPTQGADDHRNAEGANNHDDHAGDEGDEV